MPDRDRQTGAELGPSGESAEQARRGSDGGVALAEQIARVVREPVAVLDADLRVLIANASFHDLFGVRPGEASGRCIYDVAGGRLGTSHLRAVLSEAIHDVGAGRAGGGAGGPPLRLSAHRLGSGHVVLTAEDGRGRAQAEPERELRTDLAQLYLDVAGVIMVALDRAGRVTMMNRAGCEVLGCAEVDVVGEDWFARFLPERERDRVRGVFEALMRGEVEAVEHYENAVLTRNGGERLIRWHNAVVRDARGAVIGTLGSGTDITECRRAEAARRVSERRFRNLFEASPDAIFVEDLAGTVLDVNPAACRLHHAEREALVGLNVRNLVPPEQREAAVQDFERLLSGEVRYLRSYSWTVNQRALPVEIHANRFVYNEQDAILLIVRDISERLETEAALTETRARAHAIVEAALDAVITIDERGLIESINPPTERLFGYTAGEMIGQNVRMLMPPPHHEAHDAYIRRYLETGERRMIGVGREVEARRKDGSTFPIELAVGEARFGGRRIFTGFIHDISNRRRLEREVLHISEEERQRIGQDIHDGLASQFSGIALLSRGLVNQAKQRPVSTEMLEEIARLARMGAEQARALARGLNPVSLDREGLQAALAELAHSVETVSGLPCAFDVDGDLPLLPGSVATQLYWIAQEAVTNAIKHAGATRLVVQVRQTAGRLVLAVRDDGAGLAKDAQTGRGMGLHVMPYRARMIGATLSLDSAPGEGTAVTCSVPLPGASRPE